MTSTHYKILIVGAGRMGLAIARTLRVDARYEVIMTDPVEEARQTASRKGWVVYDVSGTHSQAIAELMNGCHAVIVAAPDGVCETVANVASRTGVHYVDMSENTQTAQKISKIATQAPTAFVPRCGVAPGYITSVVSDLVRKSGSEVEIHAYVGGLPTHRVNRLGYGNMWNIQGLVSEYTMGCQAILNAKQIELPPLSAYETLCINGTQFEAFTTAGSLDEFVEQYAGKVQTVLFRTLRYPGHLDYIKFLLEDLRLDKRRGFLENLLMNSLSKIDDDQLIIFVRAISSPASGAPVNQQEKTFLQVIKSEVQEDGDTMSSLSLASAHHVCSIVDVLCQGLAPHTGYLRHDEIPSSLLEKSVFYQKLLTN